MRTLRCTFALLLLTVSPAWSQDIVSGPETGGKVPALKVFDATGPNQGKAIDYKTERKEKPTVYVFIQASKWDRPMARFLKELDKVAQKEGENVSVVAVWLTEDVRKTKQYLPLAQQSLQFQQTALTCFEGEKAGPKDWNINADAHATAVVANKGKVAAVFGYASLNETDAPAVEKALKKARAEK
jgi:hypothetical protein